MNTTSDYAPFAELLKTWEWWQIGLVLATLMGIYRLPAIISAANARTKINNDHNRKLKVLNESHKRRMEKQTRKRRAAARKDGEK